MLNKEVFLVKRPRAQTFPSFLLHVIDHSAEASENGITASNSAQPKMSLWVETFAIFWFSHH